MSVAGIVPLAFVFGAALGSFLNVVILRYPSRPTGRSRCPHCRQTLRWYELIPIVSFLWQRGRCRRCRHKLSWQYPLVELTMGVAVLALIVSLPADARAYLLAALNIAIVALLVILFVIDLRTMFLPDIFIMLLSFLVIAHVALRSTQYGSPIATAIGGALIGAGFLALLWLATGGKGIGLGDVKLMLPLGALFGPLNTAGLLFAAFVIGGAFALILLGTGRATMKTPIPFGPFLAGVAIVTLSMPEIAAVVTSLTGLSGAIGW